MQITKTVNGTEATLALEGWLDTLAADELKAELEGLEEGIEFLVLDFSGLEYISSSGIRQIVAAYKKMNGRLVVKNASSGIMTIVKATGIDKKISFE